MSMSKDMYFCWLEKFIRQTQQKISDTAEKSRLDTTKNFPKNVVYKTAEATERLTGNKIAQTIVETKGLPDVNWRNIEETVILPEKKETIFNQLRQVLEQ